MASLISIAPLLERDIGEVVGIEFTGIPEYYAYFLAGVTGVVILGTALLNPYWGILLVMLLLPFRSEQYALANIGGAVIRVVDPVALFTFIGLLNRDLFTRKEGLPLRRTGVELPLLVFALWVFLSIVWCVGYAGAVSKLLQFSYAIVLFYMVVALIRTKEQLMAGMFFWVFGGLIIGGMALLEGLAGLGGGGRSASLQTSALETGEYLNYPILFAIGLFMAIKSTSSRAFLIMSFAFLLLATLIGSASRGPLIGLAFGLLFLFFFCSRFRTYVYWLIPVGVAGTVAAFFILGLFGENLIDLIAEVFQRFIEFVENPEGDTGWNYRLHIWRGVWEIYLDNPILGIGVGSLPEVLPKYATGIATKAQLAHNLYLEVFIAVGPFGFLLFLWFLWRVGKILVKHLFDKADMALYLLCMGLLAGQVAKAVGNLSFGLFFEDRVEWVAIGMCLAAVEIYRRMHEGQAVATEGSE
jgi:O-antigen ligase